MLQLKINYITIFIFLPDRKVQNAHATLLQFDKNIFKLLKIYKKKKVFFKFLSRYIYKVLPKNHQICQNEISYTNFKIVSTS